MCKFQKDVDSKILHFISNSFVWFLLYNRLSGLGVTFLKSFREN
jgi:hypothetical protein